MAALSPIKPASTDGGPPVQAQPTGAASRSPGEVVRVTFSQTWGASVSTNTHPDFQAGTNIEFKVNCLGTHYVPVFGKDTQKSIPLSTADQNGFTSKFDLSLPSASIKEGFSMQGVRTGPDGVSSNWGESFGFAPAGSGEAYEGRALTFASITIGHGEKGPTFTTSSSVDRTAKERLADCWGGTRETLSSAKSAAYNGLSSLDNRFGVSDKASAARTVISARFNREYVEVESPTTKVKVL